MTSDETKALTRRLSGRGTVTLTEQPGKLVLRLRGDGRDNDFNVIGYPFATPAGRAIQLASARATARAYENHDFIDTTVT